MRVLYFHQYFASLESPGGTRSYEFARRLIEKGHDVQMVTSSAYIPSRLQLSRASYQVDVDGIPTVVLTVPYSNVMTYGDRINAFIRYAILATLSGLKGHPDVVFATSTPLTIAIPGILAKLRHRVPFVFEVRDLWPELPIAMGALRNPIAKTAALMLERTAYHSADHIIALSPGMAAGIQKKGIHPEKITVIPNSCDIEMFRVSPSRGLSIRASLPGVSADTPLIVYAGTFGLINGVDYLVEIAGAMRSIAPEVRFLLVGSGAQKEKIVNRARDLHVLDRTLWVRDPMPKTQMPDLLASATIATSLFVPLEPMWNNSANKFFDALAAGKPIAINYGGWQADLLKETGAGLVLPANDPVEAALMLAAFACDEARLNSSCLASANLAHNRFDRDRMAQMLEEVLCTVVEARRRN